MQRQDAQARRDQLQHDDHEHTYMVRQQASGDSDVVALDLPWRPAEQTAHRGRPHDPPADPRPSLIRQIPPYGPPG